ncbi:MAG TPA: type 1 glutamine amidotransferase [Prolixibacteraceae bacterium]|nr:type 1 glutamine amidotransferase [Prolixibacteraceae bacterium]
MEKEILIVKNSTEEGPGLLEDLLIERGISYRIADLQKGEPFPSVENYKAIVVLGGPDSANDENQKMATEQQRIREILAARIPYLGICLGLQTLVKAAGGKVVQSPLKEVGFRGPDGDYFSVELTPEGMHDRLFKGLGHSLMVFHLHGETVDLTAHMTLLGAGKFCRNQIVKIGDNAYGLQCHFELTEPMFESWISEDPDLLQLESNALRADLKIIKDAYSQTGRQLFLNFLEIAGYER